MTSALSSPSRTGLRRLSFVIPNFNYARFLASAIESALAVEWPDVEVVVVDDGSTDASVDVARGFGSRIRLISQANAGPREACNTGFAATSGDVVVFLDSDDRVEPSIARSIAAVLGDDVSKVQFQMYQFDADGRRGSFVFPAYQVTPTPGRIRRWMSRTASYPTPPGSGNAYSRWFLEQIFPLDDRCGDAADSACLAAAPVLGKVVTVAEPLVGYRMHGNNRSYLLADPSRFGRQIDRAAQRHRFSQSLPGAAAQSDPDRALFRGSHLLQLRISCLRMTGSVPLEHDGWLRMLADVPVSVLSPNGDAAHRRLLHAVWSVATLIAPKAVAQRLIRMRFQQRSTS